MNKKLLMAVDGSQKGFEALSITGNFLKDHPDIHLVLFHCVQQLATLAPGELGLPVEETPRIPFQDQERVGNAVLGEARTRLLAAGFPEARLEAKLKLDSVDPANDIIGESEMTKIQTMALGRRGRSQLETLLLGSVSAKVAQYAQHHTVWIVDTPVHPTNKILIAMEGAPDSRNLVQYAADFLAGNPNMEFTFLHLMPPVPPTFWDDGHILGSSEQKDRLSRVERWRNEWSDRVQAFMDESKALLKDRGIPEKNVQTLILPTKEGVARDLLNEIDEHKFRMVLLGKKSFRERKPFLMGSHANKVLQNAKGTILCLVD